MNDQTRTSAELVKEISALKQRIAELEEVESGRPPMEKFIPMDSAAREQAEMAMRESEAKYSSLASTVDSLLLVDRDCRYLFTNENYMDRLFGSIRESVLGRKFGEFHSEETASIFAGAVNYVFDTGNPYQDEWLGRRSGKSTLRTFSPVKNTDGIITAVTVAIKDITDRKQAEEALRQSEKAARRLAQENELIAEVGRIISSTLKIEEVYERFAEKVREAIPFDRISINTVNMKDYTRTISHANGEKFSGGQMGESHPLAGTAIERAVLTKASLLINSKNREEIIRTFPAISQQLFGAQSMLIIPLISKNEVIGALAIHSVETDAYYEQDLRLAERMGSQIASAIANAQLFLEHTRTEEALRKSEARYRRMMETSLEGIWIINEEFRTIFVNQRMADSLGYAPEEILGRRVESFIFEEDREDYASRSDTRRQGVGEVSERRFRCQDGTAMWNIVSSSPLFDSEGRFTGSFSMFTDITKRKQAEEQLQQTFDRLRKAVNTTIQVLVSAVETRDAYTAGHQLKSADLARAIAMEMGLPQEKIDAIRMAASIHDIGKLSIPAEILSKPTRLSELEFALIKEHSRRGFEMLKDVESPWPLAEIVYQHHEKMDGSGYPRNLQGEGILIEARVLVVADVVEAMAAHRPYRPALGIDVALKEIEKNKGIFYDLNVADACLRLFREKGFEFATAS